MLCFINKHVNILTLFNYLFFALPGPLTHLSEDGRTTLVGIVSHGIGCKDPDFGRRPCGCPGKPGVYTRVSIYMDWIKSIIGR